MTAIVGALAVAILSAWPVSLPGQVAAAYPDHPYTAVVNRDEARFVFPLPQRDHWEFGGAAPQETIEFEWSVEVENDGQRYRFGIFIVKEPIGRRSSSHQPAAFFGQGRAFVVPATGAPVPVPDARLYARSGGWPGTDDESRLVVKIEDRATLRQLFYARPTWAVFRETLPGQPSVTRDVKIVYGNYDAEKPPPRLAPAWNRTYALAATEQPTVALAPSGRCAAVANAGTVDVLDASGNTLWQWDYGKTNRFITAGTMALAPACDMVAMVGHPGYKYTWLAGRRGQRAAIPTSTTPVGAAFDRDGQFLAIGTGGNDVLLFTKSGELKWKVTLSSIDIVDTLAFSKDNQSILLRGRGVGVLRIDGSVVWTAGLSGMAPADDLRTFVGWWAGSHGPSLPWTAGLDESGRALWRRYSYWTGAVISAAGDRIVARIDENQHPTEADGFWDPARKTSLQILARNGDLLGTLPVKNGTPVAMSPDGQRVLARTPFGVSGVDLQTGRTFEVPLDTVGFSWVNVSEDARVMLVVRLRNDVRLEWFSLTSSGVTSPP